jgi:hypothetical protein
MQIKNLRWQPREQLDEWCAAGGSICRGCGITPAGGELSNADAVLSNVHLPER